MHSRGGGAADTSSGRVHPLRAQGVLMPKEARIALLGLAAASLLAVMVDWMIQEMSRP